MTGSLLCGASQSLAQLIGARVVQGMGAGMITPIGSAMLFRAFPLEERATATLGVLSVAVVAPAIGPILGGVLVDNFSWRWIFLINLPIGLAGLTLAAQWLKEEVQPGPGRLDLGGLVLSASGVSLLIFALSTGPNMAGCRFRSHPPRSLASWPWLPSSSSSSGWISQCSLFGCSATGSSARST